jgi:N-acetyl-beta-hexosaminidase
MKKSGIVFLLLMICVVTVMGQNYALQFSNSSQTVNTGRDDISGEWTLEVWVKKTLTSSYSTMFDGQSSKVMLESWGNNGKVGITKKGVADWAFNYELPVGEWTHLAFVCNGSNTKLYVNGIYTDQLDQAISMPFSTMGMNGETPKMLLDEIRYWNKVRTAQQIADYVYQSVEPTSDGLLGYFYLDDQAEEATDISSMHLNAQILGPLYVINDNSDFTTTLPEMTLDNLLADNYNEYFVEPASQNQDVLRITIFTEGVTNALHLTSLMVSTEGTDNIDDITAVKIFYTGTKNVFEPQESFGDPTAPVVGEMTFTGDISLKTGNNYFWLVYDVPENATLENRLDASFSEAVVNGSTYVADTLLLEGFRIIKNGIPLIPEIRNAVVPKPQSMSIDTTHWFELSSNTMIVVSNTTQSEGNRLSAFLQTATGFPFEVSLQGDPQGNINLEILDNYDQEIGDEGYLFICDDSGINIKANTLDGIFYGTQTLRQLLPNAIESPELVSGTDWNIAYTNITDYPRFSWRGLHLDVSRHFFNVDFVKKYIDIMALNKLNRFHWHLTDDHGWRIEIIGKPELQSISAWRTCDGEQYGGYYTQEEITDIVNYATEKHIMVIPEIEMPGHTVEVLAAYPELSCATSSTPHGGPFSVRCNWGTSSDIFCAGKEETFQFIEDVLDEIVPLFPGPYVHLGGDEAFKSKWEQCPDCQARIQAEGLQNEEELQRYFMERVGNYLAAKDKQWIGWSEITYGGVPENATVMSWLGESSAILAAQQGHDAILTPYDVLYLDALNSNDPNEPPNIGYSPNTIEEIFYYDPMPASLSGDEQQYILGPQSCLWTEYISEEAHAEYMILPRIFALADIGWYGNSGDFGEFRKRIYPKFERLDLMGYNYRPLDFPDDLLPKELSTCEDSVVLELDIPAASFYWNDTDNTTDNRIVVYQSGTYKCYVNYLGSIKQITSHVILKEPVTEPEVDTTVQEWDADGNADLWMWFDENGSMIYAGNPFDPPSGANPWDYKIAGTNLVSKAGSIYLTGSDDYVKLENSDFLNNASAFTIEAWINIHNYDIWDRLFTKRVGLTNRIAVELADDKLFFEVGNGMNSYGYTQSAVVSHDEWHYLAFVFDGEGTGNEERMKIYLDGVSVNMEYSGAIPSQTAANDTSFTIGYFTENPEFYFTEIRLWDRALSPEEIIMRRNIQLTGLENGLQYYLKTEEEQGDTLENFASGNTYQATIINSNATNRKTGMTGFMMYGCESPHWNVGDLIIGEVENNNTFDLIIMPNPNDGYFRLSMELPASENVLLNIYNTSGKKVFGKQYNNVVSVNDRLNLSSLPSGVYLLEAGTREQKHKQLFIIR